MKNLNPYSNKNNFDIGIHHRGTYFAVEKRVKKNKILIHSPLFGPHPAMIIPLFEGVSLCYCKIDAESPISILQNPTTPDIITLTFIMERSEEHTSELQSRGHLVCRLLLEKK